MADTVINFQPPTLGLGVIVTNQYNSIPTQENGLDFLDNPPALPSGSKIPTTGYAVFITRKSPPGATGSQAAVLQGGSEFATVAALGKLNSAHQHVSIVVGSETDAAPSLTAYDIEGNQVATSTGAVKANAAGVTLSVVSSSANIVFILIQGAVNGNMIWLSSISYDTVAAATPDFLLNNSNITVSAGGKVTQNCTLFRQGGSSGAIALSAGPTLPSGVTLTFSPAAVGGTSDSFTITVDAASTAPPVTQHTYTITGTPANTAVGPKPRTATGWITVVAPFVLQVQPGFAPTVAVAPCTPGVMAVKLVPMPGLPAGTSVKLSCTGLPAAVTCDINPATLQLPNQTAATLTFSETTQPAGTIPITITAEMTGFKASQAATVVAAATAITSISQPNVYTPMSLQSGTSLIIKGVGFCQGTQVRFGNDQAKAIPAQMTTTQITVTVPRNATTGATSESNTTWPNQNPFGLIRPDGSAVPAPMPLTVGSYRNSYGYPFKNYNAGGFSYDQLTELYGHDATYWSTPFGDIRNLWADIIYLPLVNAILSGNDLCFGISLSTLRIMNNAWGAADTADLPTTNTLEMPWTYKNPTPQGPSGPLDDFIHVQHIAQMSDQWLGYYLNAALPTTGASAASIRSTITSCLNKGDDPLVCIRNSLTDGHAMIAYDIEPNPQDPAGFIIDVYDPNEEYTSDEDSDGSGKTHLGALQLSQIVVSGNGSWSFPMNASSWPPPAGSSWSGDAHALIPGSTSIIPQIPSMPGVASTLWHLLQAGGVAVFGSGSPDPTMPATVPVTGSVETAQLSDASGHTLFRSDGSLNPDPQTRVAAVPFSFAKAASDHGTTLIIKPGATYIHQVKGKVAGTYGMVVLGRPFGVSLTCATAVGQTDTVTIDTAGRSFSFQTGGAGAALRAEVMASGTDGSPRFATLLVRTAAGMKHTVSFSADLSTVAYAHSGDTAVFELHLSALDSSGKQHLFASGSLSTVQGQTTTFAPANWQDLTTVGVTKTAPAK
jgi:hypothetical protein